MKLYKYKSINGPHRDHALDLIIKRNAYFRNSDQLNDPFEIDIDIHKDRRIGELGKIIASKPGMREEMANTIARDIFSSGDSDEGNFPDELARSFKRHFYIFCMSGAPDIVALWSYYADNHSGVCIEMELDEDVAMRHIKPSIIKGNKAIFNVDYDDDTPNIVDSDNYSEESLLVFKRKHNSWKTEMESRIIFYNAIYSDGYKGELPPNSIKSVTFGMRCSDAELDSMAGDIRQHCPEIVIKRAYKIPGHRRLLSKPVPF